MNVARMDAALQMFQTGFDYSILGLLVVAVLVCVSVPFANREQPLDFYDDSRNRNPQTGESARFETNFERDLYDRPAK